MRLSCVFSLAPLTAWLGPLSEASYWQPASREDGQLAAASPEGVFHMAGESLRARRWTARKKERIHASRVQGMRLLCDALLRLRHPPRVLVNASAIGYYGDRGDEILTEASAAGTGFLATVCQELETESTRAAAGGIRVVNLRLGLVLSARGGVMDLMLPPFRLGIGGRFGGGRQYMSWITLDDVTAAIQYCIDNHAMTGPVNLVAPRPATNAGWLLPSDGAGNKDGIPRPIPDRVVTTGKATPPGRHRSGVL